MNVEWLHTYMTYTRNETLFLGWNNRIVVEENTSGKKSREVSENGKVRNIEWLLTWIYPLYIGSQSPPGFQGGGNSNIFQIFTPKIGEDEPTLTNIVFQMGWFNHQLEDIMFRWRDPNLYEPNVYLPWLHAGVLFWGPQLPRPSCDYDLHHFLKAKGTKDLDCNYM